MARSNFVVKNPKTAEHYRLPEIDLIPDIAKSQNYKTYRTELRVTLGDCAEDCEINHKTPLPSLLPSPPSFFLAGHEGEGRWRRKGGERRWRRNGEGRGCYSGGATVRATVAWPLPPLGWLP